MLCKFRTGLYSAVGMPLSFCLKRKDNPQGNGETAEDGIRTRDPQLGKLMLYQLSYFRAQRAQSNPQPPLLTELEFGKAETY